MSDIFDWAIIGPDDIVTIGDQRWGFALTDHHVPTLASHITANGLSAVYTADTGPRFCLAEMAERHGGIDLALIESTFL